MDAAIIAAAETDQRTQDTLVSNGAAELIMKTSEEDLIKFFDSRVVEHSGDPARGKKIRSDLLARTMALLNNGKLTDRPAQDCVSFLLSEVLALIAVASYALQLDGFPAEVFLDLVDRLVRSTEKSRVTLRALQFFPRIAQLLARLPSLPGSREMSGAAFVKDAVERMCRNAWPAQGIVNLAIAFRELALQPDELKAVVDKILKYESSLNEAPYLLCREMRALDLEETPPLVYQLLLLSLKGLKGEILRGIVEHYQALDQQGQDESVRESQEPGDHIRRMSTTPEQLRAVEATVMLHISYAVRQDNELGKKYLKLLKSDQSELRPFTIAVLLAVARIQRFEEPVLEFMKAALVESIRDAHQRAKSRWLEEVYEQRRGHCEAHLMEVVLACRNGWEEILKPLVMLGVLLTDLTASRNDSAYAITQANDLGIQVLLRLFQQSDDVRAEVLDQLFSRIISKTDSAHTFARLLTHIVTECPQELSSHLPKVRDALDGLSHMTPQSAKEVLQAVQPLFTLNRGFLDSTVLVLRKSMFNREIEARLVGLIGSVQLLKAFRGNAPGAQQNNSSETERLRIELLGFLRKCLSQQAQVREELYKALPDVLRTTPLLHEAVFGLLAPQLARYFEATAHPNRVPLLLNKCVERVSASEAVVVHEPLPQLLYCIVQCLDLYRKKFANATPEPGAAAGVMMRDMTVLTERILKSELEDFELDKSSDYSESLQGQYNRCAAHMLLGVYQVLMNFVLFEPKHEQYQQAVKLFAHLQKLQSVLKEGGALPKAKPAEKKSETNGNKRARIGGGKTKKQSLPYPYEKASALLMPATVCSLLFACSPDFEDEVVRGVMRDQSDFYVFVLSDIEMEAAQWKAENALRGLHTAKNLAPVLYSDLHRVIQDENGLVEKGMPILRCIAQLVRFAAEHCSAKDIAVLLAACRPMDKEAAELSANEQISRFCLAWETTLTEGCISEGLAPAMEAALSVLTVLQPFLPQTSVAQHGRWARKVCAAGLHGNNNKDTPQASLAKTMLALLLKLSRRSELELNAYRDVAKNFHAVLGDLNADNERTPPQQWRQFELINTKTAAGLVSVLMHGLDDLFSELEWALSVAAGDAPKKDGALELFERIFARFTNCIEVLQHCTRTAVRTQAGDLVLKALIRMYKFATKLVKMYAKQTKRPSARFISLADFIGANVSANVYELLQYLLEGDDAGTSGRLKRESTLHPNLVFVMEKLEAALIRANKSMPGVNLMRNFKRATARDVKLDWTRIGGRAADQQGQAAPAAPKKARKGKAKGEKRKGEQTAEEEVEEDGGA